VNEPDQQLANTHAPVVVLHPEERFAPISAEAFIGDSSLVWRYSATSWEKLVVAGDVQPEKLGEKSGDPYIHDAEGFGFSACELTRPFEQEGRGNLPIGQGFALVNPEASPGRVGADELEHAVAQAPMYYEVRHQSDATLVCYWMFFGSSAPPYQRLTALADEIADRLLGEIDDCSNELMGPDLTGPYVSRPLELRKVDFDHLKRFVVQRHEHQGDWEGVTAKVSKDGELERLCFRAHHGAQSVEADEAEHDVDGRLKVYCARGSHASYESASSPHRGGDELASDGLVWDPLRRPEGLMAATELPWYGFGGAWGDPGLDHRFHLEIAGKDFAGPLGPSRFKRIW
jgi:hypothetical protein